MHTLALAATAALIGLGGAAHPASATSQPTTSHERGVVIECSGTVQGRDVHASLYENDTYANVLQILIGDDDQQLGGSREDRDGFVDHRQVRAALKVGGHRALVTGTARRVGDRIPVSEEYDDAGQHITTTGFHRSLDTDLALRWRGHTAPLDCATAFAYRLEVVKEPTV
jgi:hypothetical protein